MIEEKKSILKEYDISIIIPSYNPGLFLREAVESALTQEIDESFEIVIADDGSEDDSTINVYRELFFATDHITISNNILEKGAAGARNTAISFSKGKYLCFLDADDLLLPDSLEKRFGLIRRDPLITWVAGHAERFYSDGKKEKHFLYRRPPFSQAIKNGTVIRLPTPQSLFVRHGIMGPGFSLIRRQEVLKAMPFDTTVPVGEDTVFYFRLAKKNDLVFIPDVVYQIRRGHSSIMNSPVARKLYRRRTTEVLCEQDDLGELRPLVFKACRSDLVDAMKQSFKGFMPGAFFSSFARYMAIVVRERFGK